MKYEVGMRWVWRDDNFSHIFPGSAAVDEEAPEVHYMLRGYISEIKPGMSIIIKWENGRMIQYNQSMIEEEPRLSLDKEHYRNQKLELLGI